MGLKDAMRATRESQRRQAVFKAELYGGSKAGQAVRDSYAKKDAASSAAKSVVKHAVVGGVLAGPAGAVVGATVGKAKQDAKK